MSNNNLGSGRGGASPYDDDTTTTSSSSSAGSPIPDFNASNIQLSTVAPAFGISSSAAAAGGLQSRQPDYLDYDQKGRGIVSTMFTNSGISYMLGVTLGGLYGLKEGLARTPSSRWKVKLNSVLNHCGRHGSGLGNMMGATAIMYSLYEGIADSYELDAYTGPIQPPAPLFAGMMTGATYYMRAGPRVAALAGTIGLGAVGERLRCILFWGFRMEVRGGCSFKKYDYYRSIDRIVVHMGMMMMLLLVMMKNNISW